MLVIRHSKMLHNPTHKAQTGVVLLVALIILIAMTLAGVALIRSMDTSSLIAGNMAFQQAATHSADTGVETAVSWLETNNSGALLDSNLSSAGYTASTANNALYQTGKAFWSALSPSGVCLLPIVSGVCSASPGTQDASGNTVSFMIQRLCNATGNRNGIACSISPGTSSTEGNNEGDEDQLQFSTSVYYRITVRVVGPRNTEIYTQTIVSM